MNKQMNAAENRKLKRNLGGRPKLTIDFEIVKKLCGIQCTGEEISAVVGVSYDTLALRIKQEYNQSFAEFFKIHSATGKASLRRTQFELAKRSPAMAIWLGKQYLGQKEPDSFVPDVESEPPEFETMSNKELEIYINRHNKKSY